MILGRESVEPFKDLIVVPQTDCHAEIGYPVESIQAEPGWNNVANQSSEPAGGPDAEEGEVDGVGEEAEEGMESPTASLAPRGVASAVPRFTLSKKKKKKEKKK